MILKLSEDEAEIIVVDWGYSSVTEHLPKYTIFNLIFMDFKRLKSMNSIC
jgi:hypothetical protein